MHLSTASYKNLADEEGINKKRNLREKRLRQTVRKKPVIVV